MSSDERPAMASRLANARCWSGKGMEESCSTLSVKLLRIALLRRGMPAIIFHCDELVLFITLDRAERGPSKKVFGKCCRSAALTVLPRAGPRLDRCRH